MIEGIPYYPDIRTSLTNRGLFLSSYVRIKRGRNWWKVEVNENCYFNDQTIDHSSIIKTYERFILNVYNVQHFWTPIKGMDSNDMAIDEKERLKQKYPYLHPQIQ